MPLQVIKGVHPGAGASCALARNCPVIVTGDLEWEYEARKVPGDSRLVKAPSAPGLDG